MSSFLKFFYLPHCVVPCLVIYASLIWLCDSSLKVIGAEDVGLLNKHFSGCIAHLFGDEKVTQQFFGNFGKNIVFTPRQVQSDTLQIFGHDKDLPTYPLLEYFPTSFLAFLARSMDLRYGASLQIVRDGYSWIDSNQPITPFILHKALLDAATVMFRGMHIFHPVVFDWALCLQNDLAVPVELDVWIYPPLSAGLNPHADFQDVLLVQMQGSLDVTVCDRIKLETPNEETKEPSPPAFSLSDIQNRSCRSYALNPGKVLYLPSGFIYYATTPDAEEISVTHAWQISRVGLTFADFLASIPSYLGSAFPDELGSYFKSVEHEVEGLDFLIDVETLSKSVDNEDLPEGWMNNVVKKTINFLELLSNRIDLEVMLTFNQSNDKRTVSSHTILHKMVKDLFTNSDAIEKVVSEMRFRVAAVYLATRRSDVSGLNDWKSLNKREIPSYFTADTLVYRSKDIRVSLDNEHDIIVINSELLPTPSREELQVYKFCLGYYDKRTAASKVFKISDIPLNSFEKRVALTSLLLSVGGLVEATNEDVSRLGLYEKSRNEKGRGKIGGHGDHLSTEYPSNSFNDKNKATQPLKNAEL